MEQVEGYVKALEKSTSPSSTIEGVFDHRVKMDECEAVVCLPRNPDPGFTPGSGSNSVAVSSNKNTEPLDFTLLAS